VKQHPEILLVDDDPDGMAALELALTRAGYAVTCASGGLKGLKLALSGRYRIVITDRMMPELDGTELCRELRRSELPGYVYVIILSQLTRSSDIADGLDAGADDYLGKPVSQGELVARLRTAERMLSLITRDVTIFALAKLAESRDPDTGAHLERVRQYCRLLSQHLRTLPEYEDELDDEFLRLIFLTSPLHDIGKVGIPDAVLLKPDRLSEEEFEVMKTHTSIGAATLEAALHAHPEALYLQMARDIALTHHERFDGSGYPLGLRGRAIPLAGRIVALADSYDALTSRRVYKNAYTHDVARAMIVEQSGLQLDPEVVEAFLSQEREFCRIRQHFADDRCKFSPEPGPVPLAA
jgi:putative two-component system response regulator